MNSLKVYSLVSFVCNFIKRLPYYMKSLGRCVFYLLLFDLFRFICFSLCHLKKNNKSFTVTNSFCAPNVTHFTTMTKKSSHNNFKDLTE